MIVFSLLILVAAAGLLVTGLAGGNNTMLTASIVASIVAGIGLYLGVRSNREVIESASDDRADDGRPWGARDEARAMDEPASETAEFGAATAPIESPMAQAPSHGYGEHADPYDAGPGYDAVDRPAENVYGGRSVEEQGYSADVAAGRDDGDAGTDHGYRAESGVTEDGDADPADEPPAIPMSVVDSSALMRMDADVAVVDGRPRFHLPGCIHLVGRDGESLPVSEAVELGFTACSLCDPARELLSRSSLR